MIFDLANAPLPHGVSVLEASAGTGKTYALAGLYLRLVVEHALTPREILVTTYTEAATAELRGRIRERLENARAVFRGELPKPDDTLLPALLARVEKSDALKHLSAALGGFDEAAIHTIHGFCERTLRERAFESGSTFDTELLTDQSALLREVAADFWRRETYGEDAVAAALTLASGINVDDLVKLLPRVLSNPRIRILPECAEARSTEGTSSEGKEESLSRPFAPLADETNQQSAKGAKGREKNLPASEHERSSAQDTMVKTHGRAREHVARFAKSWPAWRDPVREFFLTESGNVWAKADAKPAKTEPLLDALDALAESLEAPAASYSALAHFTNDWLIEQTNKVKKLPTPQHPFFDLATEFSAILESYGPAARANFLRWARGEIASRKTARGLRSFDDLLTQLDAALPSPGGGALGDAIRSRYRAALVDEFQDTDAVQDAIFAKLFGAGETWLFLIGDPKQAIYGFRGADVFTYIAAAQRADESRRYDLGTNHRSAARLVEAVNELFSTHAQPFVENGIAFHKVAAAGRADTKPLRVNDSARAPMRLWLWDEDKAIVTGRANVELPHIVAAEIRRLLASATLDGRPLRAGDCAVLTFSNRQAQAMHAALATLDIPAVLMSNASVFASREATQLRVLLAALAEPWREDKTRAALLTDFFTAVEDVAIFPAAHARWRERGFIVMFRELLRAAHIRETLLSRPGGERALTNLLQLSELLHEAAESQRLGPAGVVRWLGQQISADEKNEAHELRLERDDEAVHVVTVHKSKGLEYPVVFCPFAWQNAERRRDEAPVYHEDAGSLVLDLAAEKDGPAVRRMIHERLAEHVRLLYVALTRAKHECHVVVGQFNRCTTSSLLWLLDPPADLAGDAAGALKAMKHDALAERVRALAVEKPECFAVDESFFAEASGDAAIVAATPSSQRRGCDASSQHVAATPRRVAHSTAAQGANEETRGGGAADTCCDEGVAATATAREFHGHIERSWGVMSFSGIIEGAESEDADHDATPSPEPGVELHGIAAFPRGKRTGNCIHEVLELLDFTNDTAIEPLVARTLRKHGLFTPERGVVLAENVRRTLATALFKTSGLSSQPGQILNPKSEILNSLRAIPHERTLRELEFHLPAKLLTPAQLAAFAGAGLAFEPRRGILKGYMDLVFERDGRFHILDWKSNWLGADTSDYTAEAMDAEMRRHRYGLQWRLYLVALHRYLRVRLPDYDPARHLGEVFYIFLRGIDPERPQQGIVCETPDLAELARLDEVIGGVE